MEFPKMPRLSREMIITEKIDGTNASIIIESHAHDCVPSDPQIIAHFESEYPRHADVLTMRVGSRSRFITPSDDNYGFAAWVAKNKDDLFRLGPGQHFGEWWGNGIQRGYGISEKRFSLFNVGRWKINSFEEKGFQAPPKCCHIVPILYKGMFDTAVVDEVIQNLAKGGSHAAPGFNRPEGIIVWHVAGNFGFKKTIEKDETPKSLQ